MQFSLLCVWMFSIKTWEHNLNRHLSWKTLNFVNFSECEQAWCGHNFCPTGSPEACFSIFHNILIQFFSLPDRALPPRPWHLPQPQLAQVIPATFPVGWDDINTTLVIYVYGRSYYSQKTSSDSFREAARRKMSITSSAATMRVLSVLRHWVTKHGQVRTDFQLDSTFCCINRSVLFYQAFNKEALKSLAN